MYFILIYITTIIHFYTITTTKNYNLYPVKFCKINRDILYSFRLLKITYVNKTVKKHNQYKVI